jgi:hypothetical protein
VRLLPGALGKYTHSLRACELDERFVAAPSPPEVIAATIVHEATHARLWRCGIGYDESLRHRVEAVCCRREVAFASKLPNGERVREKVQDYLAISPTAWTNAATRDRDLEGSVQDLRHIGTPDWAGAIPALASREACLQNLVAQDRVKTKCCRDIWR